MADEFVNEFGFVTDGKKSSDSAFVDSSSSYERIRQGLGGVGPLAQGVLNNNPMTVARTLATEAIKCTSSTRPSSPVVGQMIYETDTERVLFWNGTAWVPGGGGSSVLTPVGTIVPYAGTDASTPAGWLFCGGQAVSRTTFASLFAVIGTTYGSGDGSTTFNVPDLRGRVPAGKDNMGGTTASRLTSGVSGITGTTLGAAGGDQRLHAHNHGGATGSTAAPVELTDGRDLVYTNAAAGTGTFGTAPGTSNIQAAPHTHSITTDGAGGSQNVQPTLVTNYIIKAVADTVTGTIGATLTGAAGGDLSGSYPNPSIINISNAPVHNSNTTLSFRTSNTERINVDASGRVTMPYQPTFAVGRMGGNPGAVSVITYNQTTTNVGSHMNAATGYFTAPVAGRYFFAFTAFKETTVASPVNIIFLKNGVNIDYRGYTDNGSYAATSGLQGVFLLAANDTFAVYINSGTLHGYQNCYFTGYLLG